MRTIHKFTLEVASEQQIEMPEGSEILCAQFQQGALCVWAVVNTDAPMIKRTFAVYGTGHPMQANQPYKYISTVQEAGGLLVWHVFMEAKKQIPVPKPAVDLD